MTALRFFDSTTVELTGRVDLVGRMTRLWAPFAVAAASGPSTRVTVHDLAVASAEVNRTVVAACPLPAAHCGVVTLGAVAVALPGPSGAGKSTLVTALCRSGAGYVSDEALVMGPGGVAVPYPKPVALSVASLAAVGLPPEGPGGTSPQGEREHLLEPREIGSPAAAPVGVAHVVLARRVPGLEIVELDREPRREGLATLLDLGFNHYRDPRGFLVAAADVVRGAAVWRLRYGDANRAATIMADVLP